MNAEDFKYDFAVIGLGYVGLPLLAAAYSSGLDVLGVDASEGYLKALKDADSEIHGIGVDVLQGLNSGLNSLASSPDNLGQARAIAVCVPTPVDADLSPDLSYVVRAAEAISASLRPGQLVILESTVAPGTTGGIFRATLESGSDLIAGEDFFLAYSPERIDPGNMKYGLKNTPKIVGGIDEASTREAKNLYERFVDVVVLAKGAAEAEAAKLLENTYRHINIALVNEFAVACRSLGIDVFDVIRLAETKPFGFAKFSPSAGAGGHCIPVDPNYFSDALKMRTGSGLRFIDLANSVNRAMPEVFASMTLEAVRETDSAKPKSVLVMGLTYKADISDCRESPAFTLIDSLLSEGVDVMIHDPHVRIEALKEVHKRLFVANVESQIETATAIVLLQMHKAYNEVLPLLQLHRDKVVSPLPPSVVDARFGFRSHGQV